MGTRIILRKNVVPHKNVESNESSENSQLTPAARKRKLKITSEFDKNICKRLSDVESTATDEIALPTKTSGTISSSSGKFSIGRTETTRKIDKSVNVSILPECRSIGTGVEDDLVFSLQSVSTKKIEGNKIVTSNNSFQGISEYSHSSSFHETDKNKDRLRFTIHLIEKNSRFYLGLPSDVYFLTKHLVEAAKVKTVDVLITLKKIKLNDAYIRLADDFGTSIEDIERAFTSSVPKIAGEMQDLIVWPDAFTIKKFLPIPFRLRYREVQSIINCLEIEIEKPSNPTAQASTWSTQKRCNTLKYLISSTPHGIINFTSCGYGGRISDSEILNVSGYMDVLPQGASVMSCRGFKESAALLSTKQCLLIRLSNVSTSKMMNEVEINDGKRNASLRLHVEGVNRQVTEFALCSFHAGISQDLVKYMDCVITIVAGIVNIQKSLNSTR